MAIKWIQVQVEADDDGLLWLRGPDGALLCEAFHETDDENEGDMEQAGYIKVPYTLDGESIYFQSFDATQLRN